jgi:hypothetical protein
MAVAADYADAMLNARFWKNLLFLLLFLMLLIQIGVFCWMRFGTPAPVGAATQPAMLQGHDVSIALSWLINVTDFLAMVAVVVLAVVLLLIVGIMLVGRLIGVTHSTGAFIWCVILAVLLFPWQSLWDYPIADTTQTAPVARENIEVGPAIGLPGVLYTWPELQHKAHFPNDPWTAGAVGWARFVGWPVVAIIILLMVQARSSRGLKFALGEAEIQVAEPGAGQGAGGA